ncbi:MAG: DsbC family protein [Gammaproteobacteria bacterium]|nr:DsbC family protein [Gammaproteobacteria bacterium]
MIPVSVAQAPLSQDAQDRLEQGLPGVQIDSVQLSPVRGVYEARVGAQVFYLTEDGKYAFMGDLIDIDTQTNLAEQSRRKVRAQLVETAGEDTMIVFAPAKPIRTVSVFTDVDCPYCAKFHLDVPKLVAGGVKIRYLAYPRTGVGSESYQRAVSVWCADDPRRAMGEAKAGKSLATNTCVNPVADHFRLGQEIAVKGTPTLVLDDGSMITGYISPDRLFTALGMMPVETVDPSKRGTDR